MTLSVIYALVFSLQHVPSLFVCCVFTSRCLEATRKADIRLTLGFRTISVPQLPASNSSSSQGLNHSSPLTHSLTHSTPVHCTNSIPPQNGLYLLHITSLNKPGRSSHIASERSHRDRRLQHLFSFCVITQYAYAASVTLQRPLFTDLPLSTTLLIFFSASCCIDSSLYTLPSYGPRHISSG
jgi:hypothetical protein